MGLSRICHALSVPQVLVSNQQMMMNAGSKISGGSNLWGIVLHSFLMVAQLEVRIITPMDTITGTQAGLNRINN